MKNAIFFIPAIKSPDLDGFGSLFHKDTSDIVGNEVMDVVLDV